MTRARAIQGPSERAPGRVRPAIRSSGAPARGRVCADYQAKALPMIGRELDIGAADCLEADDRHRFACPARRRAVHRAMQPQGGAVAPPARTGRTRLRLAIFGATGLTGRTVVSQALAQGDDVVALVRDPAKLGFAHARLTVLRGSPVSVADVGLCLDGADAVIHCLGIGGRGTGGPTTLVSNSVAVVLAAMATHGVDRIVCMSNVGAGGSGTWLANRVVIPLFLRWLRPIVADKDRMEASLRASAVSWISVRLPRIVDGPEQPLRVSADGRGIGLSITAASTARFLLEQVRSSEWVGATPSVSN
jgi:hypothetical protein